MFVIYTIYENVASDVCVTINIGVYSLELEKKRFIRHKPAERNCICVVVGCAVNTGYILVGAKL
jgi:hypothetical protein